MTVRLVRGRPHASFRARRLTLALAVALAGLLGTSSSAWAAVGTRPCDIFAAGGTPCVAAYSSTRAMYAAYTGPLYQVTRASDETTLNVGVMSDGYADAAAQDTFCAGTTCRITELYDQSPNANNLTVAGVGGAGNADVGVIANQLPAQVGGDSVYGMYFSGGMGYRDDSTTAVPTGSQPETEYMIADGTHTNGNCCFDFGNAEAKNQDDGNGHMDAIYFGKDCWFEWWLFHYPGCYGKGPWVGDDMENGMFFSNIGASTNTSDTGITDPFVTALVQNDGTSTFAIDQGNAQSGALTTEYDGGLPYNPLSPNPRYGLVVPAGNGFTATLNLPYAGYEPMRKEGGIILGTGGDNSNLDVGSFYEGAITSGFASATVDAQVQANIVAAGYTS